MSKHHVEHHLATAERYLLKAQSSSTPEIAQHYAELADHELEIARTYHDSLKDRDAAATGGPQRRSYTN